MVDADASRLPCEAESFDRVLAVNSFAFWRDGMVRLKPGMVRLKPDTTHTVIPGAIEGVLRVLKPGGRLVIVHQPRGRNATDEACRQFVRETTERLERAGFVNIHAQFLPLAPIVAGIIAERPASLTGSNP